MLNMNENSKIMKKLLFTLLILFMFVGISAQRSSWTGIIPVPSGADTTISEKFWSTGGWSGHLWYESLDNTDGTLAVYGSNFHPDSGAFTLLWVDQDLNGTNDLPKTLSDTSYTLWGDKFPFRWMIFEFTKVSNTSGNIYFDFRKQ